MRVASAHLGALCADCYASVIAVQTASPFHAKELRPVPTQSPNRLGWEVDGEEQRVIQTKALLDALGKLEHGPGAIPIIAFPEYSVPQRAHEQIDFQTFADDRGWIIIPGTYWEEVKPTGGRQVCRIYLPNLPPLQIAKLNPTPDEEGWVKGAHEEPNVAQLSWSGPDERRVTINVFICRDYLARGRGVTTLDDAEGLNLVLMHSRETRLFEGIAGTDLRGLGGQRRLAVFVNAANAAPNTGAVLGSALVGAAIERKEHDVVCALPSDHVGIMRANVRLWGIEHTVRKPDPRVDGPVRSVSTYDIVEEDGKLLIEPPQTKAPTVGYRAIWRAAFLEAIGVVVTIEFYAVRHRLFKVMELFDEVRIKKVYAGVARGEHDLVVRRYVPRTGVIASGGFSSFIDDCAEDTRTVFRDALRPEASWRLVFYPRDILKYRGRAMDVDDFDRQSREAKSVLQNHDTVEGRAQKSALIMAVHSLAEKCEANLDVPRELQPFLHPEPEQIIPVGPGCEAREIYLLVLAEGSGSNLERFEKLFIKSELMETELVREVFRIRGLINPPFNYLLKLKCTSGEADEFIFQMMTRADQDDVVVATRSVEIGRYLSRSSLLSVTQCMLSENVIRFVDEIKSGRDRADAELAHELAQDERVYDRLFAIADAWAPATILAERQEEFRGRVLPFYANLLMHFAVGAEVKKGYLARTKEAWRACFDPLESSYTDAMDEMVAAGVFGAPEGRPTAQVLRETVFKDKPEDAWGKLSTQTPLQFYGSAKALGIDEAARILPPGEKVSGADLRKDETFFINVIRPLRNTAYHNKNSEFDQLINLEGDDWKDRLAALNGSITGILELARRVSIVRNLVRAGGVRLRKRST